MTTKQISIFLENKSGSLLKALKALKKDGIQIIASTIADTADYGIFRLICINPERAYEVLKSEGFTASLCDVFAVELDDTPGKASDAIGKFTEAGVGISYLYSFLLDGKGILIFRTDDIKKASEIIEANGFQTKLL